MNNSRETSELIYPGQVTNKLARGENIDLLERAFVLDYAAALPSHWLLRFIQTRTALGDISGGHL